jgi:hypothetical protein
MIGGMMMEFKITAEEALEMARFEEEVGCEISAGPDYGIHLAEVLELVLHQVDRGKLVELLSEQVGNSLSPEEIEEVATSFQVQVQARLTEKLASRRSA